jgi:hypothetical protein
LRKVEAHAHDRIVSELLNRHGTTFAEELDIDVASNQPDALFRLLCASLLLSITDGAPQAVDAARALTDAGWTTPDRLAAATRTQRVKVLGAPKAGGFDARAEAMLGETAQLLLERYNGDLRRLRDEAGSDPQRERALLKQCRGLGDHGVDAFFREVQVAWPELVPFADRRARMSAVRLGLPRDERRLARLTSIEDWPRLAVALVRVDIESGHAAVIAAAAA